LPIPDKKMFLGSTILPGGGLALLSPGSGDLTATLNGIPDPTSIGTATDLDGDGRLALIVATYGSDDMPAGSLS